MSQQHKLKGITNYYFMLRCSIAVWLVID